MNEDGDSLLKFNSTSKQNQAAAPDSRAVNRKGWKKLWRPPGPGNSPWPRRTPTTDGISLTRRRPAGLSLLLGDKQTRQTVPNKSPVSVCLGVSMLGNSLTEGRACRGHWAHLVVSRFVFCTRTSAGTSNAAVATLYCSSAEQFQELGWDLKSQSKSRTSWLHQHHIPSPVPSPALPWVVLKVPESPAGTHRLGPGAAGLLLLCWVAAPRSKRLGGSSEIQLTHQTLLGFTCQLQERKRDKESSKRYFISLECRAGQVYLSCSEYFRACYIVYMVIIQNPGLNFLSKSSLPFSRP